MVIINIQKKDLYLLSAIVVFLVGAGLIIGYDADFDGDSGNPPVIGHSADEVHVKVPNSAGTLKTLQRAINDGDLTGGSNYFFDTGSNVCCESQSTNWITFASLSCDSLTGDNLILYLQGEVNYWRDVSNPATGYIRLRMDDVVLTESSAEIGYVQAGHTPPTIQISYVGLQPITSGTHVIYLDARVSTSSQTHFSHKYHAFFAEELNLN